MKYRLRATGKGCPGGLREHGFSVTIHSQTPGNALAKCHKYIRKKLGYTDYTPTRFARVVTVDNYDREVVYDDPVVLTMPTDEELETANIIIKPSRDDTTPFDFFATIPIYRFSSLRSQ
jgi:hypothetical protein